MDALFARRQPSPKTHDVSSFARPRMAIAQSKAARRRKTVRILRMAQNQKSQGGRFCRSP